MIIRATEKTDRTLNEDSIQFSQKSHISFLFPVVLWQMTDHRFDISFLCFCQIMQEPTQTSKFCHIFLIYSQQYFPFSPIQSYSHLCYTLHSLSLAVLPLCPIMLHSHRGQKNAFKLPLPIKNGCKGTYMHVFFFFFWAIFILLLVFGCY